MNPANRQANAAVKPKGLASSRFASADGDDDAAEGESEDDDQTSAALALVREPLALMRPSPARFLLCLAPFSVHAWLLTWCVQISRANLTTKQLASLDRDMRDRNLE